jgi:hypothetical protein
LGGGFWWVGCGFLGWWGGLGGEMTQALYAHMNNKIIKKKEKKIQKQLFQTTNSVQKLLGSK